MNKSGLTLLILCCLYLNSYAQKNKPIYGYSINPKIGAAGGEHDYGGPSLGLGLNLLHKKFLYSLGFTYHEDFNFLGYGRPDYYNHVSFLFGKYKGDELFRLQYQLGVELLFGKRKSNSNQLRSPYTTAGITSRVGLKIVPSNKFAIGIDLGVSAGLNHLLCSPMISLEFGRLNRRKTYR